MTAAERGRFITLEGGEGGGKSTQAELLTASLRAAGIRVVRTREPGGAPAAEDIRELLVSGAVDRWTPMAEVLLNYAAREMHVQKTIRPALEHGQWVICDRFADSTMAYQGYGGGVDLDRIRAIHAATLGDMQPDLTIVLDLPVDEGLARAGKRFLEKAGGEDRFERMERNFHERLRNGFLEIAAGAPARCRVVDARADVDTVASAIREAVAGAFTVEWR